jgi:MFS family permease
MGVVIDRVNRRAASIVTDLISAAAIAALPLIDMFCGLNLGWFIAFGIIGSLGDVPGLTARDALRPGIVRATGMAPERLLGLKESLGAVAMLLGPSLAGVLMSVTTGPMVLWVTAATSFAAALLTCVIPRPVGDLLHDAVPTVTASPQAALAKQGIGWTDLRQGWRALITSPYLVTVTALSLTSIVVLGALQALILPVYFTAAGEPGLVGFVLSCLAAGALIGGGIYAGLGTHGSRRHWFIVSLAGMGAGFAVSTTLVSPLTVFVGAGVIGLFSGMFSSLIGVLAIERIPEEMRGRIMGTQNALVTLAPAAGIFGAAALTQAAGVHVAALVAAGIWLVAMVTGLVVPPLRDLERPAPPAGPGTLAKADRSGAEAVNA